MFLYEIQEGRVGIPLTSLTQPHFCACFHTRTWISNSLCHGIFYVQWVEV